MICRKWVDNQMRGLTEMPGQNKELRDPHCAQVTARASTLEVCPAVLWGAQANWEHSGTLAPQRKVAISYEGWKKELRMF